MTLSDKHDHYLWPGGRRCDKKKYKDLMPKFSWHCPYKCRSVSIFFYSKKIGKYRESSKLNKCRTPRYNKLLSILVPVVPGTDNQAKSGEDRTWKEKNKTYRQNFQLDQIKFRYQSFPMFNKTKTPQNFENLLNLQWINIA